MSYLQTYIQRETKGSVCPTALSFSFASRVRPLIYDLPPPDVLLESDLNIHIVLWPSRTPLIICLVLLSSFTCFSSPLSPCLSAWTPDASGHLPPPPLTFNSKKWSCWIKLCREAHLPLVTSRPLSGDQHLPVSVIKEGREEKGCIVPILCLHTEGLLRIDTEVWAASW